MPLFKWVACDAVGTISKGTLYARELAQVRYALHEQGKEVVSAVVVHAGNQLGHYDKARLCEDIALLLDSRMPIADLFEHLAHSHMHAYSQYMLQDIAQGLRSGNALSDMLRYYTSVWTENDCILVAAHEQSSDIKTVFKQMSDYYYERDQFFKSIKNAVYQPLVTFVFFVSLVLLFLLAIVPRFEVMFKRFDNVQLPVLTQIVFMLSRVAHIPYVWLAVVVMSIGFICYRRNRYVRADEKILFWITTIPGLADIGVWYCMFRFYKTLSRLIAAKVPLLRALASAGRSINYDYLQISFKDLVQEITAGTSLSRAFLQHPELGDTTIVGLLKIGEKSTDLVRSFEYAAQLYKQKINDRLRYITTSVQPVMMISLGALVVLFVIAVYAPLFTFASLISNYH